MRSLSQGLGDLAKEGQGRAKPAPDEKLELGVSISRRLQTKDCFFGLPLENPRFCSKLVPKILMPDDAFFSCGVPEKATWAQV